MRNMRIKLFSLLLVLLCALPLTAAPPKGTTSGTALSIDNKQYIDANRILMFVTNRANFARDLGGLFGNDYGTYFPYAGDTSKIRSGEDVRSPLYAGGLWIGAVDSATGQTRVTISEYSTEYVPGPMEGGTFLSDRPEFKVYKLYGDSLAGNPNQAYEDYLAYAIAQGAPWDTTAAGDTIPKMSGDQMLWSVCNDADPTSHTMDAGSTAPLGLEIKQNVFAFTRTGALGNIVILQFQIFNKGGNTLQDAYFSIWTDPDLGGSGDDYVGCDTMLSVGYIYNADDDDQQYGSTTPCLGVDFFQGPLIFTGNPGDYGLMWGDTLWGYRNMGMTSFNKYINGTDPDNFTQAYNYMRGLTRTGDPYVYEGDTLTYVLTGDPVAGTGDLDIAPADRRFMMSTGPITFRPGDSTEIYAAIIVGQGANEINSIEVMKQLDDFAQQLYENGFNPPKPPAKPVVTAAVLPNEVTLTWTDTSEVDPGDYIFEGYTVWQGESSAGPWTELATYDVVNDNDVALVDSVKDMTTGLVLPDIKRVVTNTGLNYHYTATVNRLGSGKLRNASDYYYRVTAFSFGYYYKDKLVPNGDRFLESQTVVKVTPQAPLAGVHPAIEAHDTLAVEHVGPSDGQVLPMVLDPLALTGDSYMVVFGEDTVIAITEDTTFYTHDSVTTDTCAIFYDTLSNAWTAVLCVETVLDSTDIETIVDTTITIYWNMFNTTTGDTLVWKEFNISGDDEYLTFDGLLIKVKGPDPGVTKIQEVAGASGPIVPPDNVMYSLNSTRDWYVESDAANDFTRLNWRGLIGTYDWEFRFTADSSQYYDWNTDALMPNLAPFEVWNIGIGTPDDPSDDVRINFSFLDDDGSGGWSFGDRLYPWEQPYEEPAPDVPAYVYPDDFRIGRIIFADNSGALTAPAIGTIVRFTTAKIIEVADTFTFSSAAFVATQTSNAVDLEAIKAVPNPLYLYGRFDPNPGSKQLRFHHLPAVCKISLFNIAGDHVRTIDKNDPSTALATWDLLTEQGLPVASGIYIYVVDAPGFGQKIGKVAIFTEAEVLNIY